MNTCNFYPDDLFIHYSERKVHDVVIKYGKAIQ